LLNAARASARVTLTEWINDVPDAVATVLYPIMQAGTLGGPIIVAASIAAFKRDWLLSGAAIAAGLIAWFGAKGVKRIVERVSPRTFRVVALPAPTERERSQMYIQRYITHFPAAGEVVIFDRSWYNRAGVERVMGFCSPSEYLEFMREAPELERMMVRNGIILFKYWFSVTRDEQLRRFKARESEPLKKWKLSPIDRSSLDKWDDYTEAKEAMFFYTDTADAPWTIIKSDDKKRARLNCMKHFLASLSYPEKDHQVVDQPDPLIVGSSQHVIGRSEHILGASLHPGHRRGDGVAN